MTEVSERAEDQLVKITVARFQASHDLVEKSAQERRQGFFGVITPLDLFTDHFLK